MSKKNRNKSEKIAYEKRRAAQLRREEAARVRAQEEPEGSGESSALRNLGQFLSGLSPRVVWALASLAGLICLSAFAAFCGFERSGAFWAGYGYGAFGLMLCTVLQTKAVARYAGFQALAGLFEMALPMVGASAFLLINSILTTSLLLFIVFRQQAELVRALKEPKIAESQLLETENA